MRMTLTLRYINICTSILVRHLRLVRIDDALIASVSQCDVKDIAPQREGTVD